MTTATIQDAAESEPDTNLTAVAEPASVVTVLAEAPLEKILFITGRLAEQSLRQVVTELGETAHFEPAVATAGVSVAALMNTRLLERRIVIPAGTQRAIVPGWCNGDLDALASIWGIPVERGPKDLLDLPEYFGRGRRPQPCLNSYSIEILAEINHAPRLTEAELVAAAEKYRAGGADIIDLGCIPGEVWKTVGAATRRLREHGFRVSIDSFEQFEVEAAVSAGAERVLSGNSSNRDWLANLSAEIVAIPDTPTDLESLNRTTEILLAAGRRVHLDPILEPIGFGFAASLERYYRVRQQSPEAPMMMGVGNLTELTEVDSAGINFLLAAICEELQIGSILATEVINWGRSSVREFDIARRLVRHSLTNRVLPKHLGGDLVLLRDPRLKVIGAAGLEGLRQQITDPNFRIFAERGEIHILNRDGYWHGDDPYAVFDAVIASVGSLTPSHTFYLGYELCKARTALTLGKQYTQDEALTWGFLSQPETSALKRRKDVETARCAPEYVNPLTPVDQVAPLNPAQSIRPAEQGGN